MGDLQWHTLPDRASRTKPWHFKWDPVWLYAPAIHLLFNSPLQPLLSSTQCPLICFSTSAFFYDTCSCFFLPMHVLLVVRPILFALVSHVLCGLSSYPCQHRLSWLLLQVRHCMTHLHWEVLTYMYGQRTLIFISPDLVWHLNWYSWYFHLKTVIA